MTASSLKRREKTKKSEKEKLGKKMRGRKGRIKEAKIYISKCVSSFADTHITRICTNIARYQIRIASYVITVISKKGKNDEWGHKFSNI